MHAVLDYSSAIAEWKTDDARSCEADARISGFYRTSQASPPHL